MTDFTGARKLAIEVRCGFFVYVRVLFVTQELDIVDMVKLVEYPDVDIKSGYDINTTVVFIARRIKELWDAEQHLSIRTNPDYLSQFDSFRAEDPVFYIYL